MRRDSKIPFVGNCCYPSIINVLSTLPRVGKYIDGIQESVAYDLFGYSVALLPILQFSRFSMPQPHDWHDTNLTFPSFHLTISFINNRFKWKEEYSVHFYDLLYWFRLCTAFLKWKLPNFPSKTHRFLLSIQPSMTSILRLLYINYKCVRN